MLSRTHVGLLGGLVALAPFAIDMYLPATPALAADLGVTAGQAGQSISVFFLGLAAGQVAAGPLSDRWGRRPLALGGLVVFTIAALLASRTTNFQLLLLFRLTQAFGACAAMVAARAVVSDRLNSLGAARIFSILALIGGTAPILAPLIGVALVRAGDWRTIFYAMAGFSASLGIVGLVQLPETRSASTAAQARAEHPVRAYWTLLTNRRLLGFLIAAACNGAALITYIADSPAVLMGAYKITPLSFSLLFSFNAVGLVAASLINRRLLRTRVVEQALRGSARNAVILAVLFLIFAATGAGGPLGLIVLLFLAVASYAPVQANTLAGGLAVDGLRSGSTAALFGSASFALGAVMSWVAGQFHDHTPNALAAIIALCLLGSAASVLLMVAPSPSAPR
ncbi:MAG TPA: multidrug effflux MFS transporter [Caulobacteraceae bacterium]|nr:multidrug effflux MFS transporter [Caulobacteraceae bacterium]